MLHHAEKSHTVTHTQLADQIKNVLIIKTKSYSTKAVSTYNNLQSENDWTKKKKSDIYSCILLF